MFIPFSSVSVAGKTRIVRGCHSKDEFHAVGCREEHGVEVCYCNTGTGTKSATLKLNMKQGMCS